MPPAEAAARALPETEFLTVPEAARWLRIGRSKVYTLVAAGDIPAVRIGGRLRIRRAGLLEWLARQDVRPA